MPREDTTRLLNAAAAGDPVAAQRAFSLVYEQLRRSAQIRMLGERRDHTLQATELIHEVYLKLFGASHGATSGGTRVWVNRAHFYDTAARAMRQILIDHARSTRAAKRGGQHTRVPLCNIVAAFQADSEDVLALDAALLRLESQDEEAAAVVRLRFFVGLTGDETAVVLGMSPRKVDMVWARARAWLYREVRAAP
jgi:RNA polymerase sigma factor (TIGR02999 family)